MMDRITLSQLTYEHLHEINAWEVLEESLEDEDVELIPVQVTEKGLIKECGEVWCLCKAIFSNGVECMATAMCRGDSDTEPKLWSFWNGQKDISLVLPPAPKFVLQKQGSDVFCKEFNLKLEDVFPIKLEVIPEFVMSPQKRFVILNKGD